MIVIGRAVVKNDIRYWVLDGSKGNEAAGIDRELDPKGYHQVATAGDFGRPCPDRQD